MIIVRTFVNRAVLGTAAKRRETSCHAISAAVLATARQSAGAGGDCACAGGRGGGGRPQRGDAAGGAASPRRRDDRVRHADDLVRLPFVAAPGRAGAAARRSRRSPC